MNLDYSANQTRSTKRHLTLTVGQNSGDLRGNDDKILQAGADYLQRLGGGILHILPGEYTMRNALFLHPNLTLRGAGENTVLKKTPSSSTPLVLDSDWYENQIRVEDASPFSAGCGIMLRGYKNGGLQNVVRDTVVGIEGNLLSLSQRLYKNFWLEEEATAATLFPILTAAEHTDDVCVEDLVLDGNMADNEEINGNYAGAVFIQRCHRYTFRNVVARNYNGDGFSFQICDDVRFENCRADNNANLGFHPGSGSQRPVFNNCVAHGNSQGIFFCWGVTHGLVDNCTLSGNRDYGISIGHRDTDNHIVRSTIVDNEKVGLLFRQPLSEFRGGHRTLVELTTIRDNGFAADGVGIDVVGTTYDIEIRDNCIADSGQGRQKIGIRVSPQARDVNSVNNQFENLSEEIVRL